MAVTLRINNQINDYKMLTFDSIPNIITVTSPTTSKDHSTMRLNFSNTTLANLNEESGIKINGYSCYAVRDISKATGRNFFVPSTTSNTTTREALAVNVMNAFRNIPQLNMLFNFTHTSGTTYFDITSKGYGAAYDLKEEPLGNMTLTVTPTGRFSQADITNDLYGRTSSSVYVDLYKFDNAVFSTSHNMSQMEYVTTLQKEWSGEETRYNISPILGTITEYDKITEYLCNVYAVVEGNFKNIGTITAYATKGYKVNNSLNYLNIVGQTLAQPVDNDILYVYKNNITFSLYTPNATTMTYRITYYNSDESVLDSSESGSKSLVGGLNTLSIDLNEEKLRKAFYVDVTIGTLKVKYQVINPPYANVSNKRVYWHNAYGGTSFFDFTGSHDQTQKSSKTTYDKTLLDYYTSEERKVVYDNTQTVEKTLTTHLIEEDGISQLYDLLQSYDAWTDEGKIIPVEISKEEVAEKTYRVTLKYQVPTI